MFIKRTENNMFINWWNGIDKPLFFLTLFMIGLGALILMFAGPYSAKRAHLPDLIYIKKYFVYVWIGLAALISMSMVSVKNIRFWSSIGIGFLMIALAATLLFPAIKGGSRWIYIGSIRWQPSEFLKPIFAVVMAMIITKIKNLNNDEKKKGICYYARLLLTFNKVNSCEMKVRHYLWLGVFIFTTILAIFWKQPDRGMLFTFCIILFIQLFIAGVSWKVIMGLGSVLVVLLVISYFYIPYFFNRVNGWTEGTYQLTSSLNAIKQAGLFSGHTNNLKGTIPDSHTDFIFAVVVEEFGAVLASIIILLYALMFSIIFSRIKKKTNEFIILSIAGLTGFLLIQVIINLFTTLGLMPTKGMTLPFISYGGSSFISCCIIMGCILSLLQEQNLRR